ncbi:MAG: hypothetical protein FWE09_00155 [Treponema sp.]|nr:hypothetical protein [Treponema sp.]
MTRADIFELADCSGCGHFRRLSATSDDPAEAVCDDCDFCANGLCDRVAGAMESSLYEVFWGLGE